MNIQRQKNQLPKILLSTENAAMLRHVKAIVEVYKTDLWDELNDYQKLCVAQTRTQLKNGEGITHRRVMKKYKKWLTK